MASEVLIDTSGFYAILVRGDDRHSEAARFLQRASVNKQRFVTTDYIVDETATLLQARGLADLTSRLFETISASKACKLIWMDSDLFVRTRALFLKNLGRGWSFTDCMSFAVMKALHLEEALTKDSHFQDAGFRAILI